MPQLGYPLTEGPLSLSPAHLLVHAAGRYGRVYSESTESQPQSRRRVPGERMEDPTQPIQPDRVGATPTQQAGGQLSPDGQWLWTGAEWIPAPPVSAPPAAPAQQPSPAPATFRATCPRCDAKSALEDAATAFTCASCKVPFGISRCEQCQTRTVVIKPGSNTCRKCDASLPFSRVSGRVSNAVPV